MKRKIVLGIVSIMTLCLTACGKPNMTFEETVDSVTHSDLIEMMSNAQIYEESFNLSSNFSIPEDNVDAKLDFSASSKQNLVDFWWETQIAIKVDASLDGYEWRETYSVDWDAIMKYLSNAIYFKLNSLNIDWPEDFSIDELGVDVESIKNQWFSFELTEDMINAIKEKLPEDLDLSELYNEENLQKYEEDLQELKENLKDAINNEGSLVYNGMYSEFNWYNARKFSINKEKVFNAITKYIQTLIPEEYMEDYMGVIEELDMDEVFEDFPLKNFEWYLVITWKNRVQIVIENLDIEDYYSTSKLSWTFGRDGYELVMEEDWEEVFAFSAKLNKSHYDIILNVDDLKILKWTITPKKSHWKINVDFDLSVNVDPDENVIIPLKGGWTWKEISKFDVERPTNSKNLLEDIMWPMIEDLDFNEIDPAAYQLLAQWTKKQSLSAPFLIGWIMVASLMPRMQSAQDRARDVARKNDLAQIQTAIITSQQDHWAYPWMKGNSWAVAGASNGTKIDAMKGMIVDDIWMNLQKAGMSSIPTDPLASNVNYWLWMFTKADTKVNWKYIYIVTKRNWVNNAWFALMAKTESEWSSNWIVCKDKTGEDNGYITNKTDLAKINLCRELIKWSSCSTKNCTYSDKEELRYLLLY